MKSTLSSKKFPSQSNKVTDYMIKSPSISVFEPPKSVSINNNASIDGSSVQTPKFYPLVTSIITLYNCANIDSSYLATNSSTCAEGLDLSRICIGCKNPFHSCYAITRLHTKFVFFFHYFTTWTMWSHFNLFHLQVSIIHCFNQITLFITISELNFLAY